MDELDKKAEAPPGQHIFHRDHLTGLALRWKDLMAQKKHQEAFVLMEELIIGSTAMFERLAQHEGFTNTVDLSTLVQSAREKMPKWISAWDPSYKADKGLFSFLSTCSKRAFLSELSKVTQHRKRFHAIGDDNLEKFFGVEDHEATRDDAAEEAKERIQGITVRWGNPQEIGAVRYAIDVMAEDRKHDRRVVIQSLCFAYGLDPELGKFFYNWALFAMRDAMWDKIHIPFTEEDIIRHKETHSHLVDLLDIVGWELFKRIMATLGGNRIKIPTLAQAAGWHEDYRVFCEIEKEGLDPAAVSRVARRHGKTDKLASEVYEEMARVVDPDRSGERGLYDEAESAT